MSQAEATTHNGVWYNTANIRIWLVTETVTSVFNCPIRLTDERWDHIVFGHPELEGLKRDVLEAVRNPLKVVAGSKEEFLAVYSQRRVGISSYPFKRRPTD